MLTRIRILPRLVSLLAILFLLPPLDFFFLIFTLLGMVAQYPLRIAGLWSTVHLPKGFSSLSVSVKPQS